jgi:hypothetical protein
MVAASCKMFRPISSRFLAGFAHCGHHSPFRVPLFDERDKITKKQSLSIIWKNGGAQWSFTLSKDVITCVIPASTIQV